MSTPSTRPEGTPTSTTTATPKITTTDNQKITTTDNQKITNQKITNQKITTSTTKIQPPYRPLHHRSDGDLARPWRASRTAVVPSC